MAGPGVPALAKSKRKRWTAPPDPEEVTAEIMNEVLSSRDVIDRKLANYNNSFMQIQVEERQRLIEYCATRIGDLPDSVRPTVAAQLLFNDDFNVQMDFSEHHMASRKSSLAWSCADDSLSDQSWRTLLKQYVEGTAVYSSPRPGKLARTTRPTSPESSLSSPPAPSSTPKAESPDRSISMASPESDTEEDPSTDDDESDEDFLATSKVTISRSGRAKMHEKLEAPLRNDPSSAGEQQAPASENASSTRRIRHWSEQECETLRKLCAGRHEAPLWTEVSVQLPGRTPQACYLKWHSLRTDGKEGKRESNSGAWKRKARVPKRFTNGSTNGRPLEWTPEELKKLAQCRPRPGKAYWDEVSAQFPGRSTKACREKYRSLEASSKAHRDEMPASGTQGASLNLEQVKMEAQEGGGDARIGPNVENLAVL